MRTPIRSLYSPPLFQSSPILDDPELAFVRDQTFQSARSIVKAYVAAGKWPDFTTGSLDAPRIHSWPLDEHGIRFRPEMLSVAVSLFQIPDPACLCATQEIDPAKRASHTGHIRVCSTDGIYSGKVVFGCRAQVKGCGMFISLDELFLNSDLVTETYPRRPTPGPGILRFDPYHKLRALSPSQPSASTSTHKIDSTPRSNSVKKFRKVSPPEASVKHERKGKRTAAPLSFLRKPEAIDISSSDDDDLYHPPSPSVARGPKPLIAAGPPPPYVPLVFKNDEAPTWPEQATVPEIKPKRKILINPTERFFGDMGSLSEPVESSLVTIRNCDIPLLDTEIEPFYLGALRSPEGISHEVFWRLFDKCDCSQYFLKSYLHDVHGPSCLDWKRGMGALATRHATARTRREALYTVPSTHTSALPSPSNTSQLNLPASSSAPTIPHSRTTPPYASIAAPSISSTAAPCALSTSAPPKSSTTAPSTSISSTAAPSIVAPCTPPSSTSTAHPISFNPGPITPSASPADQTNASTVSSLSDEDFERLLASLSDDPALGIGF